MRGDQVFGNDAAGDQMFLNDPLQHGRVALAVPRAFRVDDSNRTTFADAQAVGFGAKDAALLGEPQLLETPLQEIPRGNAAFLVTAFRFGLVAAEKNMASRDGHTDGGRDFSLGIDHAGSIVNACSAA